jgi:hypothetical protein
MRRISIKRDELPAMCIGPAGAEARFKDGNFLYASSPGCARGHVEWPVHKVVLALRFAAVIMEFITQKSEPA